MQIPSQPASAGYANRRVTKPADWHSLVVADVLLNNLALGLFLTAATADLAAPSAMTAVAKIAYPIALICLIADLICLVLDLGDPWRFHHMLRIVKLGSPMSVGVWCLTLFSLPITALVLVDLLPNSWGIPRWLHLVFVATAILPAFGSVAYKGVLFSTTAQPGWREARWLGGYLVSSSLAIGCAVLLALSLLITPQIAAILRPAFGLLIAMSAIPLVLLAMDIRSELGQVYTRRRLMGLAAATLLGEIVLPAALLMAGSGPIESLAAVLGFLVGALVVRIALVYLPQTGHGFRSGQRHSR